MEEKKVNGVSTLAEFRAAALAAREARAQVIQLPSGLKAKLVKPTPGEQFLQVGFLPQSLAAKIAPAGEGTGLAYEDAVAVARRTVELVRFVFFEPRVPDECKPGIDIPYGDVDFAIQWARGEVTDDGRNLSEFPDKRESAEGTRLT